MYLFRWLGIVYDWGWVCEAKIGFSGGSPYIVHI